MLFKTTPHLLAKAQYDPALDRLRGDSLVLEYHTKT
jgi:hypothetical protein